MVLVLSRARSGIVSRIKHDLYFTMSRGKRKYKQHKTAVQPIILSITAA
jgi:hypothetical protein